MNKQVRKVVDGINARDLKNNTQRALVAMLRRDGAWTSAKTLAVPSAASRLRDLRTSRFGSFDIEMKRESGKVLYRLETRGLTPEQVRSVVAETVSSSAKARPAAPRKAPRRSKAAPVAPTRPATKAVPAKAPRARRAGSR